MSAFLVKQYSSLVNFPAIWSSPIQALYVLEMLNIVVALPANSLIFPGFYALFTKTNEVVRHSQSDNVP